VNSNLTRQQQMLYGIADMERCKTHIHDLLIIVERQVMHVSSVNVAIRRLPVQLCSSIIIIIFSFNVKLTGASFNNASTRYIINPKACRRKRLSLSKS